VVAGKAAMFGPEATLVAVSADHLADHRCAITKGQIAGAHRGTCDVLMKGMPQGHRSEPLLAPPDLTMST
jgi:hypothetical protein